MNHCTLSDGRQLSYREAGAGQPLVLLHGWSMSSAVFQEMMAGLAAEHGEKKTVMIGATYLNAHRTATSLGVKKGGVDA